MIGVTQYCGSKALEGAFICHIG
ncbi:hypothetical protein ATN79_48550 [Paraburkholderia caribensis]|nr:hypothetical protein ATN79_48550 [Paraburkholderia caribensis]